MTLSTPLILQVVLFASGAVDALVLAPDRGGSAESIDVQSSTAMVFVAGWEGTGHNYFDKVFKTMKVRALLLKPNWNQFSMMSSGTSWSPDHIEENAEYLRSEALASPEQVLLIHAASSSSYPNGQGSHTDRMYNRRPNINLLMEAAKKGGVDVKVLVTRRSAEETLVATCQHRHDLEPCASQALTLAENMKELVNQLRSVGSDDFQCAQYGDLGDLGRGLAFTLADTDKVSQADAAVQAAWLGESHHDAQADSAEVQEWAKPMQAPLAELDDLCADAYTNSRVSSDSIGGAAGISPSVWRIIHGIMPKSLIVRAERRSAAA